jgi:hypothetical protein
MEGQVLAALLGALVGGLASGLAALGGSVLVEKMKLRKATRIRMYEELLPPIRDATTKYRESLSKKDHMPQQELIYALLYGSADLEHISAMAGRRDQQLASRIRSGIKQRLRGWENLYTWEEPEQRGERGRWIVQTDQLRAHIEAIDKDAAALEARLRKRVN